jgi:nucleolar protein 56
MTNVDFVLHEAPVGYAIFKVVQQSDVVGLKTKEGQETVTDLSKFGKLIKLVNFSPFRYVPTGGSLERRAGHVV